MPFSCESTQPNIAATSTAAQANAFSPVSARPINSFWICDVPS
jgi:hypothetical protein